MSTLTELIATLSAALPSWVGALGWVLLLLGWLLGKPRVQTIVGKVTVIGWRNQVNNSAHHTPVAKEPGGDSALSKASNWATVAGLFITLWPVVEVWLLISTEY